MLTVIDEYGRRCLAIRVEYQLKAEQVLEVLAALFVSEGAQYPDIKSLKKIEFLISPRLHWPNHADYLRFIHQAKISGIKKFRV